MKTRTVTIREENELLMSIEKLKRKNNYIDSLGLQLIIDELMGWLNQITNYEGYVEIDVDRIQLMIKQGKEWGKTF